MASAARAGLGGVLSAGLGTEPGDPVGLDPCQRTGDHDRRPARWASALSCGVAAFKLAVGHALSVGVVVVVAAGVLAWKFHSPTGIGRIAGGKAGHVPQETVLRPSSFVVGQPQAAKRPPTGKGRFSKEFCRHASRAFSLRIRAARRVWPARLGTPQGHARTQRVKFSRPGQARLNCTCIRRTLTRTTIATFKSYNRTLPTVVARATNGPHPVQQQIRQRRQPQPQLVAG